MQILRQHHPLVQELIMLARRKEHRLSRKRCVVTGNKLVRDLGKRYHYHDLLSTKENDPAFEGLNAATRHMADERSLKKVSCLTSFNGLVGTLDLPAPSKDVADLRLLLCLDYVEDPGLLGTLLRTAVAFQWQAVFFLPRCADPFDPQCIRASQGALFEIPHFFGNMGELQKLCNQKRLPLHVSHSEGVDLDSVSFKAPPRGMALLLREEYGAPWGPPRWAVKVKVPDPWLHSADGRRDADPFEPRSLDVQVAGGILMHRIKHVHYPHLARSQYVASPE